MKFIILTSLLAFAGFSNGATLIAGATPTASASGNTILPSAAGTDWAYWTYVTADTVTAPSATSNASARPFTLSPLGAATSLIGSSAIINSVNFTTTNPEAPAGNATNLNLRGVRSNLVASVGSGIRLSLTSFTEPVVINIWVFNFQASGTMTASVNGVVSGSSQTTPNSGGSKSAYLYTYTFTPDSSDDVLTFDYVQASSSDPTSNVGFGAVSIVPEPSAALLVGLATATGLFRRRR